MLTSGLVAQRISNALLICWELFAISAGRGVSCYQVQLSKGCSRWEASRILYTTACWLLWSVVGQVAWVNARIQPDSAVRQAILNLLNSSCWLLKTSEAARCKLHQKPFSLVKPADENVSRLSAVTSPLQQPFDLCTNLLVLLSSWLWSWTAAVADKFAAAHPVLVLVCFKFQINNCQPAV